MLLIADSGSTKTEWAIINNDGEISKISTPGINPVMLSDSQLSDAINEARSAIAPVQTIDRIYFYGAGCIPETAPKVTRELAATFKSGCVNVETDMLGAARAVCGNAPGIAAILGTGSNSCYYDGTEIKSNTPPLGYILGDEGSGARLGARLINGVLKGYLPEHICRDFVASTQLTKADIIERVYRQPKANTFLASHVPFIAQHIQCPEINDMVTDEFRLFFTRNIIHAYPTGLSAGFVGSLASVFESQLRDAAADLSVNINRILARPLQSLIEYHLNSSNR